jgi:hypothetical protein
VLSSWVWRDGFAPPRRLPVSTNLQLTGLRRNLIDLCIWTIAGVPSSLCTPVLLRAAWSRQTPRRSTHRQSSRAVLQVSIVRQLQQRRALEHQLASHVLVHLVCIASPNSNSRLLCRCSLRFERFGGFRGRRRSIFYSELFEYVLNLARTEDDDLSVRPLLFPFHSFDQYFRNNSEPSF